MKRRILCAAVLSVLGLLGIASHVLSQQAKETDPAKQPSPAEMQEMMAKYMALAKPGPNHKKLDPLVGTWKLTLKSWYGGPGSEPTVTQGTATTKWALDGHFILEEVKSEVAMPGADGKMVRMPFAGMSLLGYDNFRNVYTGVWADSMGTQLLTYVGSASPDGKVFTYYGQMDEPMLGVVGRVVRYVTRVVGDDKHVFEMYDLHAGENYKVMEITYERSEK